MNLIVSALLLSKKTIYMIIMKLLTQNEYSSPLSEIKRIKATTDEIENTQVHCFAS